MSTATSTSRTLHHDHNDKTSRPAGRHFVIFTTRDRIAPEECAKVAGWATLVLRNHSPMGSRVTSNGRGCGLALPEMPERQAEEIARWFEEQLNKLPVYGFAPGLGWTCEWISEAREPDRYRDCAASSVETALP